MAASDTSLDRTTGDDDPAPADDGRATAESLPEVAPDHYTLEEPIGEGGLGRLVRAHDRRLNRTVAIKLMRKVSTRLERRFRREVEITARLQHPGIVPIHEAGRWTSGEPYYAMKLISGRSLRQRITDAPELAQRLALVPHVVAACDAMAYAHSEGVIHRDLKSSNLMVGAFGEAMVIDWGLARAVGAPVEPDEPTVIGTPAYMAPEQARGEALDFRTDVYALGAVLYELLAGAPPYRGDDARAVIADVIARAPQPLASVATDAPEELVAICAKAMARDPAQRYADAKGLADDLREFLAGRLVGAHRYSLRARLARTWRRHRAVMSVAIASAIALLAIGTISLRRVVDARARAEAGETRAETERADAEVARADAEVERTDLLLAQARLWLDRDPTVAVAWLKKYARMAHADANAVASVAVDAIARGAATQRVVGYERVAIAPDGKTLVGVRGETLVRWSITDAAPRDLAKLAAPVTALAIAPDGTAALVAEAGHVRAHALAIKLTPARDLLATTEPVISIVAAGPTAVIAGGDRGGLWRIDLAAGTAKALEAGGGGGGAFADLVASDDGTVILTNQHELGVRAWKLASDAAPTVIAKGDIKHASLSRDGTRAAWGDGPGTVFVAQLDGKAPPRALHGTKGPVQRVAFSDDGTHLATTGADNLVRVWNLGAPATAAPQILRGHTNWTQKVAFSPDGRALVSTALDRSVRVWDLATGDSQVLRGQTASITLAQFSGDGARLVTGDSHGEVRVWPVQRATERVVAGSQGVSLYLHFLPTGELLVVDEHGARIGNRTIPMPFAASSLGVSSTLTEDGKHLLVGAPDGALVVIELATGATRTLPGHTGQIYDMITSHDGTRAWSGGADRTIRAWDLAAGTSRVVGEHDRAVWHVVLSPDEKRLATAGDDLALRVWDTAATGAQTPRMLAGHTGLVYALAFSPDGATLASVGIDASVRTWSMANDDRGVLAGHNGAIHALAFSPDGKLLATASDDQTVRVWDLAAKASRKLPHDAPVEIVRFTPDGALIATGCGDGALRIWDVASGALTWSARGNAAEITDVAIAPDGRLAAVADDGSARVWEKLDRTTARAPFDLARLGSVEIADDGEARSK